MFVKLSLISGDVPLGAVYKGTSPILLDVLRTQSRNIRCREGGSILADLAT